MDLIGITNIIKFTIEGMVMDKGEIFNLPPPPPPQVNFLVKQYHSLVRQNKKEEK